MKTSFLVCLKRSFISAVVGLLLGCVAGWALVTCFGVLLMANTPGAAAGHALLVSLVALYLGGLPALVYGTLAYAVLLYTRRASISTVLVAGLLPGLLWMLFDDSGAGVAILLYCVLVAVATHLVVRYALRRGLFSSTPEMSGAACEKHL